MVAPQKRPPSKQNRSPVRVAAAVEVAEAFAHGQEEPAERGEETCDANAGEAVTGNEDMLAKGSDEGRTVEENGAARGGGHGQPEIEEDELEGEEDAAEDAGEEGAVACEQRDAARAGPQEQDSACGDRAKRGVEERGDAGARDLGHDEADAPDDATDEEDRGGVELQTDGGGLLGGLHGGSVVAFN